MSNVKKEDVAVTATNNIPSKTSYGFKTNQNEIYYFGNPPKPPQSLNDFIKGKNNKHK